MSSPKMRRRNRQQRLKRLWRAKHGPGPVITGGPDARRQDIFAAPVVAPNDAAKTTVESLGLTPRALTALHNAGIQVLGDLAEHSRASVFRLTGIGTKTMHVLDAALRANLSYKDGPPSAAIAKRAATRHA